MTDLQPQDQPTDDRAPEDAAARAEDALDLPEDDVVPGFDAEGAEDALAGAVADAAPLPVVDRLRRAYQAQNAEERRLTVPIVPGRYGGDLAFRARPIRFEKFRKQAEKAQRRGVASAEAETAFAAKVIAECCETILIEDQGDLRPLEEVVREFNGTGPVIFDSRLCQLLKIDLGKDSTGAPRQVDAPTIVRLVFRNQQAMQGVLRDLLAFFAEETAGDGEDEDEDGAERPT